MAIANFTLTLRRTVFRPAAEDHRRCSKIVVIAILVLALALRVGWSLTRGTDAGAIDALPDQREYLDLGRSLLRDGRLAMVDPRFNDLVYAFRMPGYPLLCAACGGSVTAIRMVQAMLDASTVLAVIWLARRWLSPRLSYLAGLAVALDPIYVYFSGLVLSETLFAAMLAWGAACLVHGASPLSREARGAHLVWAAGVVLLILSIYVRPSAIAFPVFLVAGAALVETRSLRFKSSATRLPVLTMVALATLVALLPWALRNRAVLGSTLFTTTNDGFTLHDGLNPDAVGSSDQSWIELLPLLPNLSELQRSAYLRERALTFARQHPMRTLALVPQKLRRTWSPWPLSTEYGSRRLYVIAAAAHALPLFVLSLVGLFNSRLPRTMRLYLLLPALIITVMHAVSVGSLRYRMPVHAPLAVLAAGAFVRDARATRPAMA